MMNIDSSAKMSSNMKKSGWLSMIGLMCALILCGAWSIKNRNDNGATIEKATRVASPAMKSEDCVKYLTHVAENGDGSSKRLFTDFPLSADLIVWFEKSGSGSDKMTKEQVLADVSKKSSSTRGKVAQLARLLTLRHQRIPLGDRDLILLQDNSVVSINSKTCEVEGVYFNRREDVHPEVRRAVRANVAVAQDKGGPPPTVDEKLDANCNNNGGPKSMVRRLGGASENDVVRADDRKWCPGMVTYANTCQLKGVACFVWDAETCSHFGGGDTNVATCPTGHCCNIKNCVLINTPCRNSPLVREAFDATTVIDNTLATVDIAVSVLAGVLSVLDKAPVVGAVFGVFNSILGLFGNLAMTPEAALNEAKQYTDEVVAEVYKCMDHEFARSWTQHIRVQVEDVQDAVAGVEDLTTPLQRLEQSWQPAAQACMSIGNRYRVFRLEFKAQGNANLLIGQTPGALRICAAVFMEYMMDAGRNSRNGSNAFNPGKVRLDMKTMVYELDTFMKEGIVHLNAYYRNSTVCGNLNIVTDKMSYLSQNLFLPSIVMASPILGGRVYQTAVLHFASVTVSNPPTNTINLGSSNMDAQSCKKSCLDDPKCVTGRYQSSSQSCVGYVTALSYGSTVTSGGSDEVFVVKERASNAMVIGDTNSNVNDASNCFSSCLSSSTCYGSRYGSSCQTSSLGSAVDHVVFRNAIVVEFVNFEWTGPRPSSTGSISIGKCLWECAKQSSCVAIDYDGVNRRCWLYMSSYSGYPGTTYTLDERAPSLQLRHFDIHYRSSVRLSQPLLVDKNVYSCPGFDLARGKTTGQKTTSSSGVASRAVDGNRNGQYDGGSCTHTSSTNKPWWFVDLGARYDICSVTLTNRADCCATRLINFIIFVTDRQPSTGANFSPSESEKCVSEAGSFTGTKRFTCGKDMRLVGRRVGVVLESPNNILTLCEVQVRGKLVA